MNLPPRASARPPHAASSLRHLCSVLLASACVLPLSQLAAQNWVGTTDGNWSVTSNWSTNSIPTASTVPTFNSNPANPATTLGGNFTIDGISFTGLASNNITLGTLNDYTLTLDGGAGTDVNIASGSGAHTINSALVLTNGHSWTNASANVFTAAGNITLSNNVTLGGTGTGGWVFGSTGSVLLNNAGDRTITVSNTGAATDLTINGIIQLSEGGNRTLRISPAAGAVVDINAEIQNGGTATGSALHIGYSAGNTGTVNLNTTKTYGGTTTISFGATLNVNAVITNGGNWDVDGGILNWNTTNTTMGPLYVGGGGAGTTSIVTIANGITMNLGNSIITEHSASNSGIATISGGTINLNTATRTIEVRPSTATTNELTISSVLADGSVSSGFTKTRNGVLTLAGDNTFTGAATINEGTVVLDHTTENGDKLSSTAALNMAGGNLTLQGNASANSLQIVNGLVVSGQGANYLTITPGGTQTATLNANAFTRANNSGGTINFALPNANAIIETTTTNTAGILHGSATVTTPTGDYFATVSGGRVNALTTENLTTLNSQYENATANWQAGANVSDEAGGVTGTNNNLDVNSLRVSGAGTIAVADTLNLRSGGLLVTASSTSTGISGGTLTLPGTFNYELVVTQNSAANFTISSNIQRQNDTATGFVDITKSGTGTLILSGNNYTGRRDAPFSGNGTIKINEGILAVSGGRAISDQSAVILDSRPGATLRLLSNETIGNLSGGGTDGGTVDLGTNSLTIQQSGNQTYSGTFSGSGTIYKQNLGPGGGQANLQVNSANPNFTGAIVVNGGLFYGSGSGLANFTNASSFTVHKGAALLIDNNGASTAADRVGNNAPITLNGANGTYGGSSAYFHGFNIRTDQNSTREEIVGTVTFNSGSNYVTAQAATSSSSYSVITANTFARANNSTASIRGTNLAATTGSRSQVRIATANEAAFATSDLKGGGGIAGTTTVSTVNWAIAQNFGTNGPTTTSGTAAVNTNLQLGNSLATYVTGAGFRALDLTSEYTTIAAANGLGTSNARESLTADLTGVASATVNGLVINNADIANARAITGAGAGASLNVTSGTILFTALDTASGNALPTATIAGYAGGGIANGVTLSGFDAGITTGSAEYIIFQNNLATTGVTISSNFTSAAQFTKSGLGSLTLTGNNTALTNVTLNEGVVQIADNDNIGGNDGNLVFAGGTLRLTAGYADDLSSRPIIVLGEATNAGNNGGKMGTLDTNGVNVSFTAGNIQGSGEFVKTGIGTLTLNASTATTHTGNFVVEQTLTGAGNVANTPQLLLNNSGGNAIGGNLQIGAHNLLAATGSVAVHLGRSDQIVDSAVINFNGGSSRNAYFVMNGFNETVAGIQDTSSNGVLEVMESLVVNTSSTLTLGGDGDYYYNGFLRNRSGGTGTGTLLINHTGTGTQTFAGANIGTTGLTTNSAGTLRYRDTTAFDGAINNNANIEFEHTGANATAWNYSGIISGTGTFYKTGTSASATSLDSVNTTTGAIIVEAGNLSLGTNGRVDDARMIEVKAGATFQTATAGYTYYGTVSGSGTLTGNVTLGKKAASVESLAVLRPGASSDHAVTATAGNLLGSITFTNTLTLTGGTTIGDGIGASAILQIAAATTNDAVGIGNAINLGTLSAYLNNQATSTWNSLSNVDSVTGVTLHDNVTAVGVVWNAGSAIAYEALAGYTPVFGDVLDLFDWSTGLTGTASTGAVNNRRIGGLLGDLELPTLGLGLEYDFSAFAQHGLIAVVGNAVPEPSRALLLLCGLVLITQRRKRSTKSN